MFVPFCETDRCGTGHHLLVEDRYREVVAEAYQVGQVHQQVDRRDIALFGETPQ